MLLTSIPSGAPRISHFQSARPAYQATQTEVLDWLATLHTQAERTVSPDPAAFDTETFHRRIRKLLYRYGCSPEKIATRGYEITDGNHKDWADMPIYNVVTRPAGAGSHARTQVYERAAGTAIERLYADGEVPPDDLVHVTCTGYASPSAAQKLVTQRGWGTKTRVTHAYHMGCYASMPALRIASGFLASASGAAPAGDGHERRADIVHSEVCTLHLRPADHTPEQLVVQSLFADGHIRYSVTAGRSDRIDAGGSPVPGLTILAMREAILPDSEGAMAWMVSDHGMYMTLSREVPGRIAEAARGFVSALFADAGLDLFERAPSSIFAVHPGGPKVIDVVQQSLELSEGQVAASRDVLLRFGNMSSATLPHIWMNIAADPHVPPGTLVGSIAFGPGLTISGALMVKT
jgi:predicted naringenin-chalcone synthase